MATTKYRVTALLALIALNLSSSISADTLPNFSGAWQVDMSQSTVQSDRPFASLATQGLTLVIDHRDPELKIDQRVSVLIIQRSVAAIYYTDGRESSNRSSRDEPITSTAHWVNNTLVIDLRISVGKSADAPIATRRDVLTLSEDGKSLVMDSTRKDPDQEKPSISHLVFRRK